MSRRRSLRPGFAVLAVVVAVVAAALATRGSGLPTEAADAAPPIRIGAVFPLAGSQGLGAQELLGVRIAAELVNADGGVAGRRVELDVRDLESGADAPSVMRSLRAAGAAVVIGAYSSDLSIAASAAAGAEGLVYWEAGAVADQLTGRGLPMVFRVGASGSNLGASSAEFAVRELAPRLGRTAARLRLAIVAARDDYAASVAAAAVQAATGAGAPIVANVTYDLVLPDWPAVMAALEASHPDVILLSSHIPDGVAFRRAMVAAGVTAGALVGTTMAECSPDFAGDLGPDAVGVFAADRPTGGFQPGALAPAARVAYDRLAAAWWREAPAAGVAPGGGDLTGSPAAGGGGPPGSAASGYGAQSGSGHGAADEYTIAGPVVEGSPAAGPTEEGLSGFTAAWALFHDVLPGATSLDPAGVAAAARAVDLPVGSLPNGAGLRFSTDGATLGQNTRAAAVIWQWQAVRSYTYVWPATYATGAVSFVPLAR